MTSSLWKWLVSKNKPKKERENLNKCKCYGIISEKDARHEIWIQVDPQAKIPLKHPMLKQFEAGGHKGLFYEGDPARLTEKQKDIMANLLSKKFNISKEEILKDLAKGILPIRADNITVAICELHSRMMI